MISLNATFLAALEAGEGLPIFYINLQELTPTSMGELGNYNATHAVLTRNKADIYVRENLLASGLISNAVSKTYIIQVIRGLTIAGTDYTVTSGWLFVSEVTYNEQEGTHLIADLLPSVSVVGIAADRAANLVIADAFSQFGYPSTITFDATRDVWYSWQFYEAGKTLDLLDARSLEGILQEKYFAYLFPRDDAKIYAYGIASNETNNEDGTYSPFAHAKTSYFLTVDRRINLSWFAESGYMEYAPTTPTDFKSLGFIADADDPSADTTFQKWAKVFDGVMYEYTQRPDLRLEQGDLLKVSTDSYGKVRCFELTEIFNKGANPAWLQIVTQLPYHPKFAKSRFKKPYTPPGGDQEDGGPLETNIQSSSFTGILSQDDSNIQQALNRIDLHGHAGEVTNGDSHNHAGGDGGQIDHGGLAGLADDDHTQYIKHALATAAGDFLYASGSGTFVKKTTAQIISLLGMPYLEQAAKVWLRATANSTTILESYNVNSIVDTATGRMQVMIQTDFLANTYPPILALKAANSTSSILVPSIVGTPNVGYFYMEAWDVIPATPAKTDPEEWMAVAFGAQ